MKDRKYLLEQLRHQEWVQQRLAHRSVVNRLARERATGAMAVRTAAVSDALEIARVHVTTWQAAYRGLLPGAFLGALAAGHRTAFWQERLAQRRGEVLVAEDEAGIMGFCDLIPSRDQDADANVVAEIAAIYVLPHRWRQGVGRALCVGALAEARRQGCQEVTLWVATSNAAAQCFYTPFSLQLHYSWLR